MTKMDCEIVHVNESLRIKLVLGPGVENWSITKGQGEFKDHKMCGKNGLSNCTCKWTFKVYF